MKNCKHCGAPLSVKKDFCKSCGKEQNYSSLNPVKDLTLLKPASFGKLVSLNELFEKRDAFLTTNPGKRIFSSKEKIPMRYNLSKIARQLLGKKFKRLYVWTWICLALYLSLVPIMAIFDTTGEAFYPVFAICGLSGAASLFLFIFYCQPIHHIKSALRTLIRTGNIKYIDEILSGNFNTDGYICCSANLILDRNNETILAYDDIVWVYGHEYMPDPMSTGLYYSEQTVYRSPNHMHVENEFKETVSDKSGAVFNTIDGKSYCLTVDKPTVLQLISHLNNPLLKYHKNNQIKYDNIVKEFKKSRKKR